MRRNPLFNLAVAQCLLSVSVWAQNVPAAPPSLIEDSKSLSLASQTFSVSVGKWPETLKWQKVPSGVGEILVYPNPPGQEEVVWNKHRLVGTERGVLCSDAENQWRIVSDFTGHAVRIAGEDLKRERLWVEEARQGLVALNRDLEVVQRLPGVKGRCAAHTMIYCVT